MHVLRPSAPILVCAALTSWPSPHATTRRAVRVSMADFADDGAEVDWDEEAKNLGQLAKPMNAFYKAVSNIEAKNLIGEFAQTAPKEVQFAVKATVASLLGNLPAEVAETSITTTGKNLASLMFNMRALLQASS